MRYEVTRDEVSTRPLRFGGGVSCVIVDGDKCTCARPRDKRAFFYPNEVGL